MGDLRHVGLLGLKGRTGHIQSDSLLVARRIYNDVRQQRPKLELPHTAFLVLGSPTLDRVAEPAIEAAGMPVDISEQSPITSANGMIAEGDSGILMAIADNCDFLRIGDVRETALE